MARASTRAASTEARWQDTRRASLAVRSACVTARSSRIRVSLIPPRRLRHRRARQWHLPRRPRHRDLLSARGKPWTVTACSTPTLHHDDHEPVRRTPGAERPVVRHGQAPPMPHCDEAASRVRHPTSAGAVRAAFGLAKTWAMIAGIIRTLGILIAVGSSAPTADARLTWVPHPGPGGGAPRLWAAAWAP